MRLRYGKGIGSFEFDKEMSDVITKSLESESQIVRVLKKEVEALAKSSESQWLIRQPKYGRSKGSKQKHRVGMRIIPPYTIEAFVENYAEYAWAIKVGRESESNIRQGKRLAAEVLWNPAKKGAEKVAKQTADQMIKKIKR